MTALSAPPRSRLWTPKHVVVTKSAAEHPHAAEILRRVAAAGIDDVEFLRGNRITGLREEDERETYARAKSTLAIVVQPAVAATAAADLAERRLAGRPGRGLSCALPVLLRRRLAVRAPGHPRLRQPRRHPGRTERLRRARGEVTSRSAPRARGHHLRGVLLHRPARARTPHGLLGAAIAHFGAWGRRRSSCAGPPSSTTSTVRRAAARGAHPVRLSSTRLPITTGSRAAPARSRNRLAPSAELALDGYPVGLTIAPIMPMEVAGARTTTHCSLRRSSWRWCWGST